MFIDIVKKRTSVRKYSSRKIERKDIDRCIEAARLAPSACNSQPWSFIVSDNRERNSRICDRIFSGPYKMNIFAKEAPVMIFVRTEHSLFSARAGGFFRGTRFNLVDIGIACEHLVLQASELGIGTCWIGWFNEKALKKELGVSVRDKFDIVITMGYPSKEGTGIKKRKGLESLRCYI